MRDPNAALCPDAGIEGGDEDFSGFGPAAIIEGGEQDFLSYAKSLQCGYSSSGISHPTEVPKHTLPSLHKVR